MEKVFVVRTGGTSLHFGVGSVGMLKRYLDEHKRVGIVASRTASRASGALDDVLRVAEGKEVFVVDGPNPNPTVDEAREIAARLKEKGVDAIVAIGGGSVIDTAKVVSVCLAQGIDPLDVIRGDFEPELHVPLYAVNLTHGTGSEVDRYAVLNLEEEKLKVGMAVMYPRASFDDPRYTLTLPRRQTLCTSLDALYHALESVTTELSSPYVLMLSEEAFRLVVEHLPLAMENPHSLEHRYWLLYASALAGIAIDHAGTNVIHAIEHGLSGVRRALEHGCGLGIIGPSLVARLYERRPKELARLLRHLDPGLSPSPEDASRAARVLEEFQIRAGLSERLSDHGFNEKALEDVVKSAWVMVELRREFYEPVVTKEELIGVLRSLL